MGLLRIKFETNQCAMQPFLDVFLAYFLDLVHLKIGSFEVFDVHSGSNARF